MADSTDPTAKVLFRIVAADDSAETETLWAFDLGADQYKLDNCPFYAYSVSLGDVVFAPMDPDEGFPTFRNVVSKSGNRTLRVILDPPVKAGNSSDAVLKALVEMGCSYEGANPKYVVINVPPLVDLNSVGDYLTDREVTWEHADPSYEELYPDGA
jgi:hypothetical protein